MRIETIEAGTQITIGCVRGDFQQAHGNTSSLGFLFDGKFGYSTDVGDLADEVLDRLTGIPLWIVEALRETPHQAHSHYEQTFPGLNMSNREGRFLLILSWRPIMRTGRTVRKARSPALTAWKSHSSHFQKPARFSESPS